MSSELPCSLCVEYTFVVKMEVDENDVPELPLHECVFLDKRRKLRSLSRVKNVNEKDKHGNTPLHLACMLGRKELVNLLLTRGASPTVENLSGWSPLAEAISYGDRQTISSVVWKVKQYERREKDSFMPKLAQALTSIDNFYMEFKWDFQSWVPLVSRVLPSDVCRLRKMGSNIRLDTTLVGFDDMRWIRGDLSILFFGNNKASHSLVVLDNKAKFYQWIQRKDIKKDFEDEVDFYMSTDISNPRVSTKNMHYTRLQKGWIFKADKTEMVGKFHADFYTIHGISLKVSKRREHLSKEDIQKNKICYERFVNDLNDVLKPSPSRRKSLTPPPTANVTWHEYITSEPGQHPPLGRPIVCKETSKACNATVAMSPDFPMTVEMLLSVLQATAPLKHFSRLRDVVKAKLPPGFPVQVDIPIVPTISARVTFLECEFKNDMCAEDFDIPTGYREVKNRFPGL